MSDEPSGDLMVVTGMTGAGRSTAAKALEDLGWYVIDNLPPQLLTSVVATIEQQEGQAMPIAVVVDVRSGSFFAHLREVIDQWPGRPVRVLFLDATDDVLVRRQEAARRPHPLQGRGRLLDGIVRERDETRDMRGRADIVIDTSNLNVHQLATAVERAVTGTNARAVRATVVSFGFKYGIPLDSDMVIDMRFLPNPHWDPELRHHTGLEAAVSDYVLNDPAAIAYLEELTPVLKTLFAGYLRERKHYFTLAVGCTGGKHRSVAMAEEVARRMRAADIEALVVHRDLGRE